MVRVVAALAALCVAIGSHAYVNPIIPGFNPDPTIIRTGKDYFLGTSSFEFYPGVPIYHSTDLIKWTVVSHAYNRPSQLMMRGTAPSGGIYAPTLRYHAQTQTYYCITTWFDIISPPDNVTRLPRSMYVHTKNMFDDNAWSDPVYVDQWGIDPDLFFDDDGKVYLSSAFGADDFGHNNTGYFSIWTAQIDLTTGDALVPTQFNLASGLPLDTPRLAEGPHIYKINGTYYLFTAEAGTAYIHREMAYRSTVGPYGPWEANPGNPLVFNGRNLSDSLLSTGHADIVETPQGDWWAVFLGTRPQNPANGSGLPQLGRETFLAPLQWNDGWPSINGGKDVTFEMPGLYDLVRPKLWKDTFSHAFVDKEYYTQRTPYKAFHSFPKSGGIDLRGNIYTLSDRETPAAFFRKQVAISTIFSAQVSFTPTTSLHEAGITIFLSNEFHNEVGITIDPATNTTRLFASTRSGTNADLATVYADLPAGGEKGVTLYIRAQADKYDLGYGSVGGGEPTYIASVESMWLQSYLPGWQNYVGAHFGFYSTGSGLPVLQKAHFAYVQTELV
ncbi:glycoside hydrolase family 43 protein [Auriscalpium vulgare]|uniref:Glycoside hydrolase family 43 protein n=1 Tax=Auriscalpium vulgare TaxID=40419 RepID=A0ACB8RWQ7_9AGAM|nr:glycoside hydrolase family 43 protein [Auriscalpium vulgare]